MLRRQLLGWSQEVQQVHEVQVGLADQVVLEVLKIILKKSLFTFAALF